MSTPARPPALVGTVLPAAAAPPHPTIAALLAQDVSRHAALARAVYRLRFIGATWGEVARALGVSKQAAHKRWRHLDEHRGDVAVVLVDGDVVYRCTRTGIEAAAIDLTAAGRLLMARTVRALVQPEVGHAA